MSRGHKDKTCGYYLVGMFIAHQIHRSMLAGVSLTSGRNGPNMALYTVALVALTLGMTPPSQIRMVGGGEYSHPR